MHEYIEPLIPLFAQHADSKEAEAMEDYMKNNFPFLGIRTQSRRLLQKEFFGQYGLPPIEMLEAIVMDLYALPEREYHAFARELCFKHKKEWPPHIIELFEWMLAHNAWWDSVDYISSDLIGTYFKIYPEEKVAITQRWNKSDQMWFNRASIVFQVMYKEQVDTVLLAMNIEPHTSSREPFIEKAIGWALREYSKINPQWVMQFVKNHELRPLSEREAMRLILARK